MKLVVSFGEQLQDLQQHRKDFDFLIQNLNVSHAMKFLYSRCAQCFNGASNMAGNISADYNKEFLTLSQKHCVCIASG